MVEKKVCSSGNRAGVRAALYIVVIAFAIQIVNTIHHMSADGVIMASRWSPAITNLSGWHPSRGSPSSLHTLLSYVVGICSLWAAVCPVFEVHASLAATSSLGCYVVIRSWDSDVFKSWLYLWFSSQSSRGVCPFSHPNLSSGLGFQGCSWVWPSSWTVS